jgi:hypothetical protein
MKAKETHVARGASPFITKADVSPIPSPIMKACASPFITKAGASPIPNIERRTLQRNVSVLYTPYKAHSQLGQNSGGTRSAMFLPFLCLFGGALQKFYGDKLKERVSPPPPLTIFTPLDLDYQ